jgi:hypothetical protein
VSRLELSKEAETAPLVKPSSRGNFRPSLLPPRPERPPKNEAMLKKLEKEAKLAQENEERDKK